MTKASKCVLHVCYMCVGVWDACVLSVSGGTSGVEPPTTGAYSHIISHNLREILNRMRTECAMHALSMDY